MNSIAKRLNFGTSATAHYWFRKSYFLAATSSRSTSSRSNSSTTTTTTTSVCTANQHSTPTSQWLSSSSNSIQHHNRNFSSSSSSSSSSRIPTITRRRRMNRGGGATSTTSSNSSDPNHESPTSTGTTPIAVRDPQLFASAANSFLNRVQDGLEPMKECNKVFQIIRSRNEDGENLTIRLMPSEGQYVFQVYDDMTRLTMISPMSGSYTYVLCSRTGQFVGMDDGHICEGMLVRDLIRHCNGLPKF